MADRASGGETALVEKYFAPLAADTPGAFGLCDDAGQLPFEDGQDIVLTTDMIVAGVHFLETATSRDIAYKALAVNISDLCAKGAQPSVYLLSIALPATPSEDWLQGLSEGFAEAQAEFGCRLLGGDTVGTPGPVSLSITAAGYVPEGKMVHRSGARDGDCVYVSGTIGDAALGLAILRENPHAATKALTGEQSTFLKSRYWRPRPRLEAIDMVRNYASASMDISDGMAGDFAMLCVASGTGGVINVSDVPLSDAASSMLEADPALQGAILSGGDDYELLVTVSEDNQQEFERAAAATGLQFTRIGRIDAGAKDGKVLGRDGKPVEFARPRYEHF